MTRRIKTAGKNNIFFIFALLLALLAGTAQPVFAEDWSAPDMGADSYQQQGEEWYESPQSESEDELYSGNRYNSQTEETYGNGQAGDGTGYSQDDGSYTEYGSVYVNDYFGFTRSDLVLYMLENQEEYLGTPYVEVEGESQEPGTDGHMQCEGFVWNVLHAVAEQNSEDVPCWEDANTSPYENGGGWVSWIYSHDIVYYTFSTKEEMLASGVLEKGDIIWSFDQDGPMSISDYHHVGFFWGDSSDDDVFWHSNEFAFTETYAGEEGANRISQIEGATDDVSEWWVVKMSTDEDYEENLEAYQLQQETPLTAQSVSADEPTDTEEDSTSVDSSSVSTSGSEETILSGADAEQTGSSSVDSTSETGQNTGGSSVFAWLGNLWEKIISAIKNFLDRG